LFLKNWVATISNIDQAETRAEAVLALLGYIIDTISICLEDVEFFGNNGQDDESLIQ